MVSLKRAPSPTTLLSVMAERMKDTSTPRMVSECVTRRPMWLPPNWVPNRPATTAPTSGASGTASRVDAERVALMSKPSSALQRIQLVDVDARLVAEQQHQQRQADGRFGRRHRQDEEDEDLAVHVAEEVREGDEVHVDGQQHQLHAHQQH